jgi:hypothetical protein
VSRRITGGEKPPGWDDNPIGQLDYMTQARRAMALQRSMQGHVDPNFNLSVQADDYTRGEFLWLRRGLLCTFQTSVAAVALANAVWQLQPRLGTLAIVTELRFVNLSAGATQYSWGLQSPTGGLATGTPHLRDERASGTSLSACTPQFGTEVGALASSGGRVTVAVNETVTVPVFFVLTGTNTGGRSFRIVNGAVNALGEAGITWSERTMNPQEA